MLWGCLSWRKRTEMNRVVLVENQIKAVNDLKLKQRLPSEQNNYSEIKAKVTKN